MLEHKSATLPDTCYSCSHIPVHCSSPPGTPRHCSGLPGGTVWWQCGQRGPPETNLNSARRRRYQHQWPAPRRKACYQHQPRGRAGALTCNKELTCYHSVAQTLPFTYSYIRCECVHVNTVHCVTTLRYCTCIHPAHLVNPAVNWAQTWGRAELKWPPLHKLDTEKQQ